MKKGKTGAALLAALLVSLQLSAAVTQAESIEDKKAELQDVQQQMEEKDAQRENKKAEIKSAVDRLIAAQNELAAAKRGLAEVEGRQRDLEIQIRQNEAALYAKQQDYDRTREIYKKRLRDIYENGQVNYLDVLLGSTDFRDFASRMFLLQRVIHRDFALIARLETQKEALQAQQATLEANKRDLDATHAQVAAKQQLVQQKTAERQALYEQALAEKAQLDAEYEELQRSSAQITDMIKRMEEQGRITAAQHGSGRLSWPIYGEITSPFGWRVHPIWGTQIFHAGIDIACDYGDPIRAADGGVVIYAGWMGGYGNAVMIDHGGGLVTLYGHNTSLNVSEGESVSKGQVIAQAGSTGDSTGPHCHFEVRVHGEVTQPLDYLP